MTRKLSEVEIEHVAKLAYLPLTTKEIPVLREQLSRVVSYIDQISEIEKLGKETLRSPQNVTLEDKVENNHCLTEEEALKNANQVHNGLFVVPAVLEE